MILFDLYRKLFDLCELFMLFDLIYTGSCLILYDVYWILYYLYDLYWIYKIDIGLYIILYEFYWMLCAVIVMLWEFI